VVSKLGVYVSPMKPVNRDVHVCNIYVYMYIYTRRSDIYHLPPAVAAAAACKNASSAFCSSPPSLRVNSLKHCVCVCVCAFRRPGCTQFYIIYNNNNMYTRG